MYMDRSGSFSVDYLIVETNTSNSRDVLLHHYDIVNKQFPIVNSMPSLSIPRGGRRGGGGGGIRVRERGWTWGGAVSFPTGVEALQVPRYEEYGISYRKSDKMLMPSVPVMQTAHAHVLQKLWVSRSSDAQPFTFSPARFSSG